MVCLDLPQVPVSFLILIRFFYYPPLNSVLYLKYDEFFKNSD